MAKKEAPKEKTKEKPVEVENIRLSKSFKDDLLLKLLREKFEDKLTKVRALLTACLESEHDKLYPEIRSISGDVKRDWFEFSGAFKIKRNTGESTFEFQSQTYFPRPRSGIWRYAFIVESPSKATISAVNDLTAIESEKRDFKESLQAILRAVNTSKQLCEIIPELSRFFPKKISGSAGDPRTQLVPIDLIRSVRNALSPV